MSDDTAKPDSWKTVPFGETVSIPYRSGFSDKAYDQLKSGLIPEQMEDKWFIYFEADKLYFHRSWTGQPVFRVEFEKDDSVWLVVKAEIDTNVLKNGNVDYQAELLNFLIANLMLGQNLPFPLPADLNEAKAPLYQHSVSGTGYQMSVFDGPKKWWRFWRK